ncbi:MAG TPA: NAD(P)-dependent oxidoreductase [Acidimicrobiales bacterium]|jgi:nucleoside-diphosphate-sugar epimerase|nr:NAD(P)-dependent oxidoreductase [Acidimicrobiales bacterium]
MAPTALVTGGRGFIASALVPALVDQGWEVRSCGRSPRPDHLPDAVDYVRADLADEACDLAPLVSGVSHVFHLAGASSSRSTQEEMERDNALATERLMAAAMAAGPEVFLHMSSTSVYGEEEQLPSPVPETVEPRPSRGYGKAKWMAEQVVWRAADQGVPVVVLRPVSVHGPGATKLLASAMLDIAIERFAMVDTVLVHEEPVEQRLLHLDDLVAASIHLATHEPARGRAFNVAMPTYPSSVEVAALLADEFGLGFATSDDPDCGPTTEERAKARDAMLDKGMTDDILFTPERFRFMRKANRNNRLDLTALESTGFRLRQTDLRAAVSELAAWYAEHRWIL